MTYYEQEIKKIRRAIYSNQRQIDTVIKTRAYIDNHFHQELSLDHLSRIHSVSKYHLLRLFKKYYGQTPQQYLITKRMEKSKEYLRAGKTVTETCFAIGFNSLGSFSSLFKRRTGMSPLEFQKRATSKKQLSY